MNQVLNKVRDLDPNDSEAVKEALTSFFQNLSKNKEFSNFRWLQTLENIINRFPKYCGTHRATIENYLIHYLDSNNYYHVIHAAKCAHALQQVRAPQDKGSTPKSSWRDQMSSLCDAALTLIDTAYNKTSSIYKHNKTQNESQDPASRLQAFLEEIDSVTDKTDSANKSAIICTRLRNVFVFIQAMLVEVYPVPKPIRPQMILQVILKALNSSGKEESNKVTTIKVQALKTLDALVACLGSNLIPFSALVFRFIMQTLRWSTEHSSEESSQVRCTAYKSLTKWLDVLHTYRSTESRSKWDEELTSHILCDVTPRKHVIQLTASKTSMKNLSKKARKRLANTMLQESNISSHMPGEKNKIDSSEESSDEIAIAALECAETFLTSCGIFLKPVIHKQFQELLVRECYNMHSYKTDRSIHLLRALEASRKCGGNVPPPTQYCLHLYSQLVNSNEREISKFCSHALLDIRLHLHHSPPSLNFALEVPEARSASSANKKFSERNRAVLESLLGKERMPSEDVQDEVITIQDEPVSKKPRTDIADNISLSSDSLSVPSNEVELIIEDIDDHCDQMSEIDILPVIIENDSMSETDEHDAPAQSPINEVNREQFEIAKPSGNSIDNGDEESVIDSNTSGIDNDATGTNEQPPSTKRRKVVVTVVSETTRPWNPDEKTRIETINKNSENIHTVRTQLPVSNDDINKSPVSIEVTCDYPAMGQENIRVLEKTDDENISSTNDADDIQIINDSMLEIDEDDAPSQSITNKDNHKQFDIDNNPIAIKEKPTSKKGRKKIIAIEDVSTSPWNPDEKTRIETAKTNKNFENIHEVSTQLPTSSDEIDKSPVSMEVTYDYPATGQENIKVLEKTDDENLPSTSDTDDIQISCGQVLQSQDNVKVNGAVNISQECNGNAVENEKENRNLNKSEDVTVEDMLADFVDEVNDENATPA